MFDGGLPEYRRKELGEGEKSMMVTVAKDGSGDYTGIHAAVDSIPEYPGE